MINKKDTDGEVVKACPFISNSVVIPVQNPQGLVKPGEVALSVQLIAHPCLKEACLFYVSGEDTPDFCGVTKEFFSAVGEGSDADLTSKS